MKRNVRKPIIKGTPQLPNRIKRTARVLILRCHSRDLEFYALWQEKKHKGIERLVLPGGQIEINYGQDGEVRQEQVLIAAVRETLEEISVSELNIKHYLGAYSRNTSRKSGYKHTYVFIGKIKGKVKVKETHKFNPDKSCFYSLTSINKHPHAPHLRWISKLYKKGRLDQTIKRFIRC